MKIDIESGWPLSVEFENLPCSEPQSTMSENLNQMRLATHKTYLAIQDFNRLLLICWTSYSNHNDFLKKAIHVTT